MDEDDWTTEFPKEEGHFWFYGYRYGKVSCVQSQKPELLFVKVRKISNGYMHITEGHCMWENEVEDAHFQRVKLPKLPRL